MREEIDAGLEKRAGRPKTHSQPGFAGKKNEHIRVINKGPAGKKYRTLAIHFLEDKTPEEVHALYATPA